MMSAAAHHIFLPFSRSFLPQSPFSLLLLLRTRTLLYYYFIFSLILLRLTINITYIERRYYYFSLWKRKMPPHTKCRKIHNNKICRLLLIIFFRRRKKQRRCAHGKILFSHTHIALIHTIIFLCEKERELSIQKEEMRERRRRWDDEEEVLRERERREEARERRERGERGERERRRRDGYMPKSAKRGERRECLSPPPAGHTHAMPAAMRWERGLPRGRQLSTTACPSHTWLLPFAGHTHKATHGACQQWSHKFIFILLLS